MSFTALSRVVVATSIALVSCIAIAKEVAPRILQDPVLGLRYEVAKVHFDPLPRDIFSTCPELTNAYVGSRFFIYARAQDAARTYYVVGGYYETPDPEPNTSQYSTDELGLIFYVQGTKCTSVDAAREVFDSRPLDMIPQPILKQLATSLAATLAHAFGGPDRLGVEWRNQHIDQDRLPPELREAFKPYLTR
jgi:hypothetical protein